MKPEKLIGKQVEIIDKNSLYFGHWGYVSIWDGNLFHIHGGSISTSLGELSPVFDRNQFKVRRKGLIAKK